MQAIAEKDYELLQYYIGIDYAWDHRASCALADAGNVDVMRWAINHKLPLDADSLTTAARAGNVQCVALLLDSNCPRDGSACASTNSLEVLQHLRKRGCVWDQEVCANAVSSGNTDILEWAIDNGCPLGCSVCADAAAAAQSDTKMATMMYLVDDHNCPLDAGVSASAAQCGDLEMLRWLVDERGCPVDARACSNAAEHGHLDVLQYLRMSRKCEWDAGVSADDPRNKTRLCRLAFEARHYTLLAWAIANGAAYDIWDMALDDPSICETLAGKGVPPHIMTDWPRRPDAHTSSSHCPSLANRCERIVVAITGFLRAMGAHLVYWCLPKVKEM